MTHTRTRKFNTKNTYPEQKLDNDLCQAVVARGSIVFVRGQVGQDLDTAASIAIGDPAAQADQAMANIKTLLEEAGARLEERRGRDCGGQPAVQRPGAGSDGPKLPGQRRQTVRDAASCCLAGGLDQGGEVGPVHSAGLRVVREVSFEERQADRSARGSLGRLRAPGRRLCQAREESLSGAWL
jgi:hypothetical protein